MNANGDIQELARCHSDLTRRYFMNISAFGAAGLGLAPALCEADATADALRNVVSELEYLTRSEDFKNFGRGTPPPHTLPAEKLREVGLHRDTWCLEVAPDPESDSVLENPLTKERGTSFGWNDLMEMAETRAVRVLSVVTCTNLPPLCGMGLWEGVPLRDVVWLAKPKSNIRRIFYYGYHNDDPAQRFQSSLPFSRVLEDSPCEHPVLLCYKLNEQWLTPKRGGPVRILVPGQYGNKSVKWVQHILLTNNYKANDTYALKNNDTVSPLKTCARFINVPENAVSGKPIPVTGVAQVGISGLQAVQWLLLPEGASAPEDDPYFTSAQWRDADILPPPKEWGGGLPGGKITEPPVQFDASGKEPAEWPLRHTIAHWATLIDAPPPGRYDLRCRTIDSNGHAQPMPRPYKKSGNNTIQTAMIIVK